MSSPLHLGLHASRAKYTPSLSALGGVAEEGSLAYAGLAAKHQHGCVLRARAFEHPIQLCTLGSTA